MAAAMTRWRWNVARGLRAIGLPGWVALLLACAALIGVWGVIEPLRAEARQLDVDSDVLAQRLRLAADPTAPIAATPQQQLLAFRQHFPGEQGIAPSLAHLQAAAQRQGLQLNRAEFRFSSEPAEPLARYAITLPVQADYRALRRFTRDALRDLPGLAMEEVNLRRSDPKSPLLDAQLRFVLFVAQPQPVKPATMSRVALSAAPSN